MALGATKMRWAKDKKENEPTPMTKELQFAQWAYQLGASQAASSQGSQRAPSVKPASPFLALEDDAALVPVQDLTCACMNYCGVPATMQYIDQTCFF